MNSYDGEIPASHVSFFFGGVAFLVGSEVGFSEKICANDYIIPKHNLRGFWGGFPLLNYYFWGGPGLRPL